MDSNKDYYTILGITENATKDEISKRYKKLAKENHPDLNPGDKTKEERFKEITEAYEVLSDDNKKAEYDNLRKYGSFNPMDGMNDFFSSMFGSRGFKHSGFNFNNKRVDGSDTIINCVISFNEFIKGCQKEMMAPLTKKCTHCNGSGSKTGHKHRCPRCNGTGYEEVNYDNKTHLITNCRVCHGTGEYVRVEDKCPHCNGNGMIEKATTIKIDIPAGKLGPLQTNIEGNDGINGGRCGSVYVKVIVNNTSPFEILEDFSLSTKLTITVFEAMLGVEKRIITPHGPTTIKIPSGIQNGKKLRIPNKGIPLVNTNGISPLYVEIAIEVPTNLNEKETALIKKAVIEENYQHYKMIEKERNLFKKYEDTL